MKPTHTVNVTKPLRREIELDFIRGIAILMVIDYHAPRSLLFLPLMRLGWLNFGWAGVDIFFVLSGFLVGGLLVKEWKTRGQIHKTRFLIRRGFKIWPQYYVFLILMLVTGHRTMHQLWGNFLNIQNYVGGVAHTWTLSLEEHAYLLLLTLLAFAAGRGARTRHVFLGVAGLAALVVVWRTFLAAHGVQIEERTDTRIDGILYGLLLAMLYHFAPQRFHYLQRMRPVWITVILIALLALRMNPHTRWWWTPLRFLLMDASGVALLLLLYRHRAANAAVRSLPYRAIAWVGLYSYGIYLWHVAPIAGIEVLVRHLHGYTATSALLLLPWIAGILLGVLMTKLIEFPALGLRDRLFPREVDSAVGRPAVREAAS